MKLEKAKIEDLELIQNLNFKLFEDQCQYNKDLIKNWPLSSEGKEYFTDLIENEIVYIAYEGEEVVGYLAGTFNKDIPYLSIKVAEIDNMFVHEDYRGHNIGKLLINAFKDECNKKGIYNYIVSVYYENTKAIKFYERNGFDVKTDITLINNGK